MDLNGVKFKEYRMQTTQEAVNELTDKAEKVSLETLAKMTGFPVEMIKEEIFKGQTDQEVSLNELRQAMLNFIDSTILLEKESHS
jgi:hypothetical protein